MKVYILISEHWDDSRVVGVYATKAAALKGQSGDWREDGDGGCYRHDLPYGQAMHVDVHEVED